MSDWFDVQGWCDELDMTYYDAMECIDHEGEGLTTWEIDFMEDIAANDSLSAGQAAKVIQIYKDRVL